MATPTYVPIQSQTLTSNQANIDFTSIPATYTDLKIVFNGALATGDTLSLQFNSDTGSNYSYTRIIANGSAYSSYRESSITIGKTGPIVSTSITTPSTVIMDVMNYSNSNTYKTVLSRTADQTYVASYVTLWRNTNSINTIRVRVDSGVNILSGSTATLYGIANAAIGAPKATGGIITYDNTYYYHTFGASGTFTPQQSLTADILVVAGGGGGAKENGTGGGGAGGLLGFASQSLTATGYTVTVGAGGAGATVNSTNGGTGGDSQFGALTLVKGGGYSNSGNGGSGGGAYPGSVGGSATSGQGNAGGNGIIPFASPYPSGGGGGAGAAGANGVGSQSGNGGIGLSTYNSWSQVTGIGQNVSGTYYLAGGGGGGTTSQGALAGAGGYGGGAAGGANNGLANTGGGGGGGLGGMSSNGGSGGSGVVIVRYLKA